MSAESSIEKALEDAEGKQRRNGAAVAVDARRRHVVLNRFVIVRQTGAEPALEERGEIHQAGQRVSRRPRDRPDGSPRTADEPARVVRSL